MLPIRILVLFAIPLIGILLQRSSSKSIEGRNYNVDRSSNIDEKHELSRTKRDVGSTFADDMAESERTVDNSAPSDGDEIQEIEKRWLRRRKSGGRTRSSRTRSGNRMSGRTRSGRRRSGRRRSSRTRSGRRRSGRRRSSRTRSGRRRPGRRRSSRTRSGRRRSGHRRSGRRGSRRGGSSCWGSGGGRGAALRALDINDGGFGALDAERRIKREIDQSFIDKHIAFVKKGKKINYNVLRGRLPKYAQDDERRARHTYILVPVRNSENEALKRAAFIKQLNEVVKNKFRSGKCKAKRNPNRPGEKQTTMKKTCKIKNKPKTQFPGKEVIHTFDYYTCPIGVRELGRGIRLVEFNLQDPNVECRSSESGQFQTGMGILKSVNNRPLNTKIQKQSTNWFLVNHLDGSQLENGGPC